MILLKASPEFITDLFTPGMFTPHRCVEGLPKDITLVNVTQAADGIVTFVYDDGKVEQETVTVKYETVLGE